MSPAKHQYDPTSIRGRIRAWLANHPGAHRPRDIAAGLGVPVDSTRSKWTIRVGAEVSRMALAGELQRVTPSVPGGSVKRPPTYYALADTSGQET